MVQSDFIKDVTEADFDQEVIERSKQLPVVVDFWAAWCQPCQTLKPMLERIVGEQNGEVALAKVNTDEEQELASRYGINSLPTVIAFKDGQPVTEFEGVLPEKQLRQFFETLAPSEAERSSSGAASLEESSPDEAEKLYREALAKDANQEKATIGLARVLMNKGKLSEAQSLLENAGTGNEAERVRGLLHIRQAAEDIPDESELRSKLEDKPKDAMLHYQLGCRLALAKNYEDALAELYTAGLGNPELAKTKVREMMVKIFHIIGDTHALADEYRGKLTMLLY